MPHLSLTDFVSIVSASGTPKATKVRQVKHRGPYSPAVDFYKGIPAVDFYKGIREGIVACHKDRRGKKHLARILERLTDKKKITNYAAVARGYRRWWGRKALVWFEPPHDVYTHSGVDVSINPELGLTVDGQAHVIKLHFKADPLSKKRVDIITHLMGLAFAEWTPPDEAPVMSVLDVRRWKLISPTVPVPHLTAIVDAELAYVAALWPSV